MAAASPFNRTKSVKDWAASKSVEVPGAPSFARSAEHGALNAVQREGKLGLVPKFRKGQGVKLAMDHFGAGMTHKRGEKGTVLNLVDDTVPRPKQQFNVKMANGDVISIPETKLDEA